MRILLTQTEKPALANLVFIFLLIFSVFTTACNKDDVAPEEEELSEPVNLDRMNYNDVIASTKIATISGAEVGTFTFSYDGDRISTITEEFDFSDSGLSMSLTQTYQFNYSAESFDYLEVSVVAERTIDGQIETSETNFRRDYLFNEQGQLTETVLKYEGEEEITEFSYFYNSEGKLLRMEEEGGFFTVYEWDEANLSSESIYYESNAFHSTSKIGNPLVNVARKKSAQLFRSIAPQKDFEATYNAYDENKNPLGILSILYGYPGGLLSGANNPTKIKYLYFNTDESIQDTEEVSVAYEYNEEGLPTNYTFGGEEVSELIITYK